LTSREVVRYPQPATRSVAPARRLWNHLTSFSAKLQAVMNNFLVRYRTCINEQGGHLNSAIFKT